MEPISTSARPDWVSLEPVETQYGFHLVKRVEFAQQIFILFTDDAMLVMKALPDASLSRAFVLFPDPWPKSRHHKRRFVQRANLDVLARLLKPGAELRLATDDPSYLPWMIEHACTHAAFEWLAERPADWRGRPADWPPTRYEQKMLAGHQPAFLRFRRR